MTFFMTCDLFIGMEANTKRIKCFKGDLSYAHAVESITAQAIKEFFTSSWQHTSQSSAPQDVIISGEGFEIKSDEKSVYTGNFFIETKNLKSNKPSGIVSAMNNGNKYYVHCIPGKDMAIMFPTKATVETLYEMYADFKIQKRTVGTNSPGKSGNAEGYVLPVAMVKDNLSYMVIKIPDFKKKINKYLGQ